MEFEGIRVAIAIFGCAAATYYDLFNNRNVPNLLTYGLVAIGAVFALWGFASASILAPVHPAFLSSEFLFSALMFFGPAILILVFGYYFYINGQIGGADILLFIAIALLLPNQPASLMPSTTNPLFQLPYVVSVFAISGVIFSLHMLLSFLPKVAKGLSEKKIRLGTDKLLLGALLAIIYGFFIWSMSRFAPTSYLVVTMFVVLAAIFVYLFKDFILDEFIIQKIPFSKITEEDVLAIEKMDPELVKKHGLKKLLTASELARMKSLPIKEYPIYVNMPCFMPYILLALVITLITGDIFLFLMKLS